MQVQASPLLPLPLQEHINPGGQSPGMGEPNVPQVVTVVVVGGTDVVVVVVTQPPASQASQQLENPPAHAPAAWQRSGVVTLHRVRPSARVRQQVTASGRPQVEVFTQRLTVRRQAASSCLLATRARMTLAAQPA